MDPTGREVLLNLSCARSGLPGECGVEAENAAAFQIVRRVARHHGVLKQEDRELRRADRCGCRQLFENLMVHEVEIHDSQRSTAAEEVGRNRQRLSRRKGNRGWRSWLRAKQRVIGGGADKLPEISSLESGWSKTAQF